MRVSVSVQPLSSVRAPRRASRALCCPEQVANLGPRLDMTRPWTVLTVDYAELRAAVARAGGGAPGGARAARRRALSEGGDEEDPGVSKAVAGERGDAAERGDAPEEAGPDAWPEAFGGALSLGDVPADEPGQAALLEQGQQQQQPLGGAGEAQAAQLAQGAGGGPGPGPRQEQAHPARGGREAPRAAPAPPEKNWVPFAHGGSVLLLHRRASGARLIASLPRRARPLCGRRLTG